jgi:hypothetical protein
MIISPITISLKNELAKSIKSSNKILINKAIGNIEKIITNIDNSNIKPDENNNIDDDDDSDNLHNLLNHTMTLLTEIASLKEMITLMHKLVKDINKNINDGVNGDCNDEVDNNLIYSSKGIIGNMIKMMKNISYCHNLKVDKMSVRINELINNDNNNSTIIR